MTNPYTNTHTQLLYIPKSLILLELEATIKTIVALVIILKMLPSDWSRHIQSCGQILFIKRAKTSARLLSLKAPTVCVFVSAHASVLDDTRVGQWETRCVS